MSPSRPFHAIVYHGGVIERKHYFRVGSGERLRGYIIPQNPVDIAMEYHRQ
jgi:hypothetical protein